MEVVRSVGANGVRSLELGESPAVGDYTDTNKETMVRFLAQYGLKLGSYRMCSKTFPVITE